MRINKTISIEHTLWERITQSYNEPFSQVVSYALERLESEQEQEQEPQQAARPKTQASKPKTEPANDDDDIKQTQMLNWLKWTDNQKKLSKPLMPFDEWLKAFAS